MYRKEVNERSPLRILEKSIHGGLGKGNLGLVMARAGTGKTACMVQIGLDDLLRSRPVLHIALGQTLDHVHSWYDALFDDLARVTRLEDRESVRASVARHRMIQAYGDSGLQAERVREVVKRLDEHLGFRPQAVLIDGYSWEAEETSLRDLLCALKECAGDAELWMSAPTHRQITGDRPTRLPSPYDRLADLIDVAVFLEPHGAHVHLRLLKDHDNEKPTDTHIELQCDTMRLVRGAAEGVDTAKLPPAAFTLLSGAAPGAESEFGACAERWGLTEHHFTFDGHRVARSRGLAMLGHDELRRGDVSSAYLVAHMHRTYPSTPLFKKVLQSIWHQVNTAGEVFVVGSILPDNTVKGGTGWAAELAKHEGKPLCVFDQEKRAWFRWKEDSWVLESAPVITRTRFTGTGTRFLNDAGREAIAELFSRSFGRR